MSDCHHYTVELIHRTFDWNASFSFMAPHARAARRFATAKLYQPDMWLVVRAKRAARSAS